MDHSIPKSHSSASSDLPLVKGRLIKGDINLPIKAFSNNEESNKKSKDIIKAFSHWKIDEDSNLFVVMGGYGSGKTFCLSRIEAQNYEKVKFYNFSQLIIQNEGNEYTLFDHIELDDNSILVVDNFDPINTIEGFQVEPPNLKIFKKLSNDIKIVISTRRTWESSSDELLDQLSSSIRLGHTGYQNPYIFKLVPYSIDELKNHASEHNAKKLEKICQFLEDLAPEKVKFLSTPQIILMLLAITNKLDKINKNKALVEVYSTYCNEVLNQEYDQANSRISSKIKNRILSLLAFDIFLGKKISYSVDENDLSIEKSRISERVLEIVTDDKNLRNKFKIRDYLWTDDFLNTNHLLRKVHSQVQGIDEERYTFKHASFYEYFVSQELVRKILNNKPLGLEEENLSPATFSSLIIDFTKHLGGESLLKSARRILNRPNLSTADRIVLLYFLEDDPKFADYLSETSEEYISDLIKLEKSVKSFFLKKMIRYQLVIVGKYSAFEYVREVREHEDKLGFEIEHSLHSTKHSVSKQLLERLKNKSLKKAIPITIFRLSQFGEANTLDTIQIVRNAIPDSEMTTEFEEIFDEAITRIKEREL